MSTHSSEVQYATKDMCTKISEAHARALEDTEDIREVSGSDGGAMGDASMGRRRLETRGARRLGLGEMPRDGVDEWEDDDDQRNVAEHWPLTQPSRALSVPESECHAIVSGTSECLGMQLLLWDLGLKAGCRTWKDSNAAKAKSVEKGFGQHTARVVEILVGASNDQIRKSEHHEGVQRTQFSGSLDEWNGVA